MSRHLFQSTPLNPSIERKPKNIISKKLAKWLLIFSGIFVASGLVFFLLGRSSFSEGNVKLEINGPTEIPSGEKVTFVIEYANNNKQALKGLKLTFFYPSDSIVLKEGKVSQVSTENVELPDLNFGENGKVEFSAYLVGDRGDIKQAGVLLVFSPEGTRSIFEKKADLATNIASMAISLTLVAPPSAVSGQELAYILDYRNESQDEFTDLKLEFSYPDGFSASRFSPLPDGGPSLGQNIWNIRSIKPGEGQRIAIFGILKGNEREGKTVSVVLRRKVDDIFVDYEKSSSSTVISTPPLTVNIEVNNKSDYIAKLGDELDYQISFTNNSKIDLLGLTVVAKMDGIMFDTSTINSNGFFNESAKSIVWNASSSPLLNRLASGQKGAVNFRIKLKENFAGGGLGGVSNFAVKVSTKAETRTIPTGFDLEVLTAESDIITQVSSLPAFEQNGFYADNITGATNGPFPPKAGEKTFYTISWKIDNASNDFSRVRIKGALPVGVIWEGDAGVNGQQVLPVFNSGSREVVWDLGVLPAGIGSQFPTYRAWFRVSFTPSSNNVGQIAKLIQNTFLEGGDSFTKQAILVNVNDVTTNDLVDFPSQGRVME